MVDLTTAERELKWWARSIDCRETPAARLVELPVCYDIEFGPDLDDVARWTGLAVDDVIKLHSGAEYLVCLIGFAPGFPYLSGMPPQLATPRLETPRISVPAGSVGIAGEQTGVYPLATPGGWRIIGRTPCALFSPDWRPPSLLTAGDVVRFRPIDRQEFLERAEEGAWRSK
jgi:inhibitor of KinA